MKNEPAFFNMRVTKSEAMEIMTRRKKLRDCLPKALWVSLWAAVIIFTACLILAFTGNKTDVNISSALAIIVFIYSYAVILYGGYRRRRIVKNMVNGWAVEGQPSVYKVLHVENHQ